MKQEMTPLSENIRYENAPSKASEEQRYKEGYELGYADGHIAGLQKALDIITGADE